MPAAHRPAPPPLTPTEAGVRLNLEPGPGSDPRYPEQRAAYMRGYDELERLAMLLIDKPFGSALSVEGDGHAYWLNPGEGGDVLLLAAPMVAVGGIDIDSALIAADHELGGDELARQTGVLSAGIAAGKFCSIQSLQPWGLS